MAGLFHFRLDLTFVKVDDITSSQVFSGTVQGSAHFFSSFFGDGSDVRDSPEI